MKIIYTDGSVLTCNTIEVCGKDYLCDGYRIVPICDVEKIVEE